MGGNNQTKTIESLTAKNLSEFARLLKGYFAELDITPEFHRLDQDVTAPLDVYTPPHAGVWLAYYAGQSQAVGMAAIRKIANRTCELKRMYVVAPERHNGFGQLLLDQAMNFARRADYFEMLLSMTPQQKAALTLFTKNGFKPCARYSDDKRAGIFFSYKIKNEVK